MNKKLILTIAFVTIFLLTVTISASADYPYLDNDEYSTNSDDALFIMSIIIIGVIIGIVVWIIVTVWAYRDAQKRGENAVLWALIVFFGGIVGLIVWFVVRQPIGSPAKNNPLDASFNNPRIPDRMCPSCGRIIPFDAMICPYCARKF